MKSIEQTIVTLSELEERCLKLKAQGQTLVTTNGCFDLLHPGHVLLLQAAKTRGDILIVGVNSDASVRALGKGRERPINEAMARMQLIASLRSVDFVFEFHEPTPMAWLEKIKPDRHIKGGDYKPDELPEKKVVEKHGGVLEVLPFIGNFSTTSLIQKLQSVSR